MDSAPPEPDETNRAKRPRMDNLELFEFERAIRQSVIDEQKHATPPTPSITKNTFELLLSPTGPDFLGFFTPSDEASLALTNQTFHYAVVNKSKRQVQRIQTNLPVDKTFAFRIREHAVSSVNAAASRRVECPSRPVLHFAKKVPLYTLKNDEPGHRLTHCVRLDLNPSGTRLVVLKNSRIVDIYDPTSKPQCIQSFSIILLGGEEGKAIYYYNTRVVVRTQSTIQAYTETGVFLYAHRFSSRSQVVNSVKHGQSLLLTLGQGRSASIVSFNVHSGVVQKIVQLSAVLDPTDVKLCGVYVDRWLLVHQDSSAAPAGLYVYDLANEGAENNFFAGKFRSVVQGEGKSASTIYALENKRLRYPWFLALELSETGRVSEKHSFRPYQARSCMLASFCSSMCSTSLREATNSVNVFSNYDGTVRCRTLAVPKHHTVPLEGSNAVSNEKELFVPLSDNQTGQMVIAAYIADEHF